MTITFPRDDIFSLCGVRETEFWPLYRQELSRVAGGRTQAKDLGSPIWRASFTTAPQDLKGDARALEAALLSLNGSAKSFLAHDMRFPFPQAYPDGVFADTATIGGLFGDDAFKLTLSNLASGFVLSPGDYLGFQYGARPSRALHRVVSGGAADGAGNVTLTIRPALRPGAALAAPVTLKRAPCEMILEPGSPPPKLQDLVASSVSFSAVQIF